MKTANPVSRFHLNIGRKDRVLDVGSGNNPHPRADTLVDKFLEDDTHRAGSIRVLDHQELVQAEGENMPFENDYFDYVISSHVLEHVDDPAKFINELMRVGKRGYIETPSLIGEFLIPKASHRWLILDINDTIYVVSKERANFNVSHDFGDMLQLYFQQHSWGYKILQRTHPQLFTVNYEWKDTINFVIEPEDEEIMKYFRNPWDVELMKGVIPHRGIVKESMLTSWAVMDIIRGVIQSKIIGRE